MQNLSTCKAPQQLCLATCCCRLCREGGAKRLVGNATGWQRLKVARSLHQIGKATRDLALGDCCRSEEEVKAWHTQVVCVKERLTKSLITKFAANFWGHRVRVLCHALGGARAYLPHCCMPWSCLVSRRRR